MEGSRRLREWELRGGRGEGEGKSRNFTPKLWQQPTKRKDDTEIANQ